MARARAILHGLRPGALFFGPIFQREVVASGRRRGTYVARCAYALGLLVIVGLFFNGMRDSAGSYSAVSRLQALQTAAPQLALVIAWFQFVAMLLGSPILSAGAICDEKRARTLAVLMTTPLTSAQIVVGKLASRLVHILILSLIATPFLLAIRVCGGLDAALVLGTTALALTTAVLGASLGLLFSVGHARATTAAVMGLLALLLVQGGPAAAEGVIYYAVNYSDLGASPTYEYHKNILATCAPATMGLTTLGVAMGTGAPDLVIQADWPFDGVAGPVARSFGPTWAWCSAYNLVMAAGVTLLTIRVLRRRMLREASGGGAPTRARRRRRRAPSTTATPEPAIHGAAGSAAITEAALAAPEAPSGTNGGDAHDEPVRERERQREVSNHPVLWRELRQSSFGSRRAAWIVVLVTLGGLILLYANTRMSDEGLHATIAVLGALVAMIQPVFLTTGGVAGEREARTWEVLLTTPLSGRAVVLGKYLGLLRAQWFLPSVALGHLSVAALGGWISWWFAVHAALIFLGPALFLTATGQLFSLVFRKAVTAAVANLGVALALWLGVWVALLMGGWFMDWTDSRWFARFGHAAYALNPVAMAVSSGQAAMHPGRVAAEFTIEGFSRVRLSLGEFTAVVVGVLAAYAALGGGVLALAALGFRRLSGRSS